MSSGSFGRVWPDRHCVGCKHIWVLSEAVIWSCRLLQGREMAHTVIRELGRAIVATVWHWDWIQKGKTFLWYKRESGVENETLTTFHEICGGKPELDTWLLSVQSWKIVWLQICFILCVSSTWASSFWSCCSFTFFSSSFYFMKSFLMRPFAQTSL